MHLGFIRSGFSGKAIHRTLLSTSACPVSQGANVTMTADKMLHAVYRVGDLGATRKFLEALGMKLLRERDVPSEKYSNAFYGYGSERKGEYFSLELTYNYGIDSYDIGTGFGHFGIAAKDAATALEKVQQAGFKVTREAGSEKAIAVDPTGYKFEILEQKRRDPLARLMLRVTDLEKSIAFYEAMGMRVQRKSGDPKHEHSVAYMGFGEENDNTVLELRCKSGESTYTAGNGYAQLAVSAPDVYDAAARMKEAGITLTREAGPVPGIGTKICAVRDPDGWKTVLVDAEDFEKEFE